MPHRKTLRWLWQNIAVIVLIVAAVAMSLGYFANQDRIADNNARISDVRATQVVIQRNRVESCQRTYEGVREVLRPFFRPAAQRTAKERRDIRRFNNTVDRLKDRCNQQVKGAP